MNRTPVESSLLASIGFDPSAENPALGVLEIEFPASKTKPASVYQYEPVPADLFKAFQLAESKGRFFLQEIKGKFQYRKIEPQSTTPIKE